MNPHLPSREGAGRTSNESARTCARTSRVTDPVTGSSQSSRVLVRGGKRPLAYASLVIVLALTVWACGGATIIGTEIPDTDENREVYDIVSQYRMAVEERNIEALEGLVSRRYYENNGTTDRDSDDYGFDALVQRVMPLLRENIKAVEYRMLLRRIDIEGERAYADYEYFCNYKYVEGGEEGWRQINDFNRLELLREDGAWKISGGL